MSSDEVLKRDLLYLYIHLSPHQLHLGISDKRTRPAIMILASHNTNITPAVVSLSSPY